MPTDMDIMMTSTVSLVACSLLGHVTRLSSAIISLKNCRLSPLLLESGDI